MNFNMNFILIFATCILCLVSAQQQLTQRVVVPPCATYVPPSAPPATVPYLATFSLPQSEACQLSFPIAVGPQNRQKVG